MSKQEEEEVREEEEGDEMDHSATVLVELLNSSLYGPSGSGI